MTKEVDNTGRKADDVRIGLAHWFMLILCAGASLTSLVLWMVTDDPTTKDCAPYAACIFAALLGLILFSAKEEIKTNKMLRDYRVNPEDEKTN